MVSRSAWLCERKTRNFMTFLIRLFPFSIVSLSTKVEKAFQHVEEENLFYRTEKIAMNLLRFKNFFFTERADSVWGRGGGDDSIQIFLLPLTLAHVNDSWIFFLFFFQDLNAFHGYSLGGYFLILFSCNFFFSIRTSWVVHAWISRILHSKSGDQRGYLDRSSFYHCTFFALTHSRFENSRINNFES